jgi:hypothetical protein
MKRRYANADRYPDTASPLTCQSSVVMGTRSHQPPWRPRHFRSFGRVRSGWTFAPPRASSSPSWLPWSVLLGSAAEGPIVRQCGIRFETRGHWGHHGHGEHVRHLSGPRDRVLDARPPPAWRGSGA